jgi:hypothetical protein
MRQIGMGFVLVSALVAVACQAAPPAVSTPPTVTAAQATPLATQARPLGLAVAAGSPTPTPVLVGDYATLVRPRLEGVQQGLMQLDQQLAVLLKLPMRMADDDWRAQTLNVLDDLAARSGDLRTLGRRAGANDTALSSRVMKLLDNIDFVVSEYRMALDYDPDGSHFARAGHARLSTEDDVASALQDLRGPVRPAPSPSFGR